MAGSSTAPITYSSDARKVQPEDWNAAWSYAATTYQPKIATILTKTAAYTASATDDVIVCSSTSTFTVTLPVAVVGKTYRIRNINTGVITVDAAASDTINSLTTQDVHQWSCLDIQCHAANTWGIV